MLYLLSSQFWMIAIVIIICAIGGLVFLLRKHIPGLVEYEEEDEETIAENNVSRILMTLEEEEKYKDHKFEDEEELDNGEENN